MKYNYSKKDINNIYKFINETNLIATSRKKILSCNDNNGKFKLYDSIIRLIIYNILFILMCLLLDYIHFSKDRVDNVIGNILFISLNIFTIVMIIICSFSAIYLYLYYVKFKKTSSSYSGTIIVNEEGITDKDNDKELLFKWKSIDFIVIANYSICILLNDTKLYLRLPLKEKLIDSIKKVNNKVKIIDLR